MASQSIMSSNLKVDMKQITYELTQQGPEVELHLSDQSSILVRHLKAITLQSCLPKEILQSYTVIGALSKWTLSHKYVLSDINHTPLLDFLTSFLENFIICFVEYQVPQLQKPVEEMIDDMEDQKEIVTWDICKRNNSNELLVLASRENDQIIRTQFQRLKEYRQEVLIYPLDDYLQKSKLKASEYQLFLKGLLRLFDQAIRTYASKRMKKVHMHQDLSIKRITWMNQELQKSSKINTGVVFEVIGFGQKLGKLYQFVERWFEKINWILLEVEQIECCKRDKVEDWLLKNRKAKAVLVSPRPTSNVQEERVVVFQPAAEKPQLQNDLLTAVRLISGREFCSGNSRLEDNFHLIFKYQSDFKKFMMGQKGGQSNLDMKIYQQYVLVSCDRLTELKVRKKISQFLQLYQEEEVHIEEFKSAFHIVIFKHYYSSMIRTKPIKIELVEGKLFRCNSKQKSQQVQNQIKEIYRAMRKQLVFKPISRPLSHKIEAVQVTLAPRDWTTPECLQSRRYKLTDKLCICLRSYGSISNSDSDCIFLVDNFERCVQLNQILEEEEVSNKFESLLKKNKKMSIPLRYCRYFDNITVWLFEKEHYRQKRNGLTGTKLKNDMQGLLESCSNPLQLQLMLPSGSEELVETLLPTLLEILLESCSFDSSKSKKEITIYTSCFGGDLLRKEIIQQLRRFNRQARVDRITDLDLRQDDLQKIVAYKYLELKYYDNKQTKCASPVNSYIFSRQILKKGKTPIFLPSQEETKYNEYLVSFFSSEVYQIQGDEVIKLKQKVQDIKELEVLVDLVKKYFPMLDYVVIFGNVERGVFSKRLVYTEPKESMYKIFEELQIDLSGLKILCANNKVRIKYELNHNEFLQLYRVETHPRKAAELSQLKWCVLL